MKKRRAIAGAVAAVAVAMVAIVAWAGMGYEMMCRSCNFRTHATFGGGMMFDQITCWCDSCGKFVYLQWKVRNLDPEMGDEGLQPKPEPMGRIWDPETGRKIEVYACPGCKKPAVPVTENVKHCPKCSKPTFGIDPDAPVLAID